MELILWRHAEAADTAPDMARELTAKGRRQAREMADWLSGQLAAQPSRPVRVIASPAARTRQTADALQRPVDIVQQIDPNASADALLAATGWPEGHGVVILVGHNPAISELAARLAGADDASLSLGRAAAWWYASNDDGATPHLTLKAAMTPALLHQAS